MNTLRELMTKVKKVVRHEFLGECWEWQGSKSYGYGKVKWRKSRVPAHVHRIMAALFVCDLNEFACVCHSCDNRACCNPAHLIGGTKTDNGRDMAERCGQGRQKLGNLDVQEIRERHQNGETYSALCKCFGVDKSTIGLIVVGKTHVKSPGPIRSPLFQSKGKQ